MSFLDNLIEHFIKINRKMKKWQRMVSALSAVIVFITTYSLILPAITLDKDTAQQQPGIEVAASEANVEERGAAVVEAEPEEEPVYEETAEPEEVIEEEPEEIVDEEPEYIEDTEPEDNSGGEPGYIKDTEPEDTEAEEPEDIEDEEPEDRGSYVDDNDETDNVSISGEEAATDVTETLADDILATETLSPEDLAAAIEAGEIELITEKTQLVYEYIDEEYEKYREQNKDKEAGENTDEKEEVDDGYFVYAEFDASAKLPVGVELQVKEITEESDPELYAMYCEKTLAEVQDKYDENTGITFAKFYDISFVYDGKVIEPSGDVKIRIEYKREIEVRQDETVDAIHFDKENDEKPELIESEVNPDDKEKNAKKGEEENEPMKAVEFTSDRFSVYGVVGTGSLTTTFLSADGKTYEVTVTCDTDANIPAGSELVVSEVEATADKYEEYLASAAEAMDVSADKIAYAKLLDISIVKDGEDITPQTPADVQIRLLDREEINETTNLSVFHYEHESEKPVLVESSEEKDGAVSFAAEGFSVYGVFYTVELHAQVISASGDTYEITVDCGEDAMIPYGAELKVREILSDDEEFADLYQNAVEKASDDAKKQGIEMPIISGARLFDIEIQFEGEKIEPSAPVQVSIRLIGTTAADHTSVIHFGEDGTEAMTAQTSETRMSETKNFGAEAPETETCETTENEESVSDETAVTEVSFEADSFSVYTVVKVTNFNSVVSSGKKYALVTGISGDPGATTGYSETWGRDYFTIIVNAQAMSDQNYYDDQNRVQGLQASPVHAYEDGSISYVGGNPVQWQFESAGSGRYYISVDGKYLQRYNKGNPNANDGWEARLVDNRNAATQFTINVNSDGTILIHDGNFYLHNESLSNMYNEWSEREYRFTNQGVNTNSSEFRFRLCEESDQFDSFAARKVSVQNLTVNDSFLIYRKFEDSKGNEQLFALASDGTFVRIYDGGDTVYWRETDKNVYWNYRMEGGYYSIYSTDPATNETVYINPMHSSEPPQTITSEPSRLTLIGKDNGDYWTAIENWDQAAYDYAGLHVTVDQGEASLSTGIRTEKTSDEFMFAVASTMPSTAKEMVDTVDSEALGIHITVYDYGLDNYEYNAGDKLNEMADVVASSRDVANNYQPHAANALVKPYLENGLPSSKTRGAMTGLFTANGSAVKYSQSGVTKLFLKSYYDETGMFRYRSEDNYAYLGKGGNTEFTVYRQAATPYPYDTQPGHTYYTHGHYMPFNDIDMTQHVSRLMNQYGNEYTNNEIVGELPVGDGRTYEDIYGVSGIPNFFTGMKMEADFTQLKDGRVDNGDPMVFKFTGDDDMWVYIDGVLVLDIGGIHEPLSGTIDFSTGEVNNPTGSSLAGKKTLYEIFMDVLNNSSTPSAVKDKIRTITWKDVNGDGEPDTFADYTNHDFKAFYMERGAGASNLDIQFNLKVLRPGEVVVEKLLPEGVDPRFVNQEYKFQATFKDYLDGDRVKPLFKGATNKNDESVCSGVYYKGRKDDEGNPVEVPVDEEGYFTLRAGEAAVFMLTDKNIEYTVKEVEIDTVDKIELVEINDRVVAVENGTAAAAYATAGDRSQLRYKNHPFLQNLNIVKYLLPEGTQAGSGDVFEFRVYLESLVEVDGEEVQQLIPYSYAPYYVTKADRNGVIHYYTLTGENNAPEDKGTDPVVCSTTGRSGSINSIPPEYTVVIPNLAVGTHFYIEERRDNIPAGYVFDHEDLVRDNDYDYDEQILGSDEDIISRILARDEKDHQTFDHDTIGRIKKGKDAKSEVFNRKTSVKIQKQWLRINGRPYTLAQARQLPGSTNAVITAELWRKKIVEDTSGDSEEPVTVTFMVNTSADSDYRLVSEPVTIGNNSTLEFSLGARGTSLAQEIHSEPEYTISHSNVSSNPMITYSNGQQKENWSKYTISGITENTTIYATFDAEKVSDDYVGLYIASKEEPGHSEIPVEEKVADIVLNDGNDWLQQVPMEQGYTYFLRNVAETGLEEYTHQYTFIGEPTVTTDANGNLTLAVANKYREPINVTVEKDWTPQLTSEEESDAYVIVELHRYAKKTKGVFEVVLKDNYGAHIEGAVFKLYKDGVEQEEEYTTDVNGRVIVSNLEPGTYKFKQISTPEGYSMPEPAPETDEFVVEDNKIVPQEMHCELENEALETEGVATLTLHDNNGDPIQGAKYNLIRRNGSHEEVITEGLETDENGQITVDRLSAGTYYFFETEAPEDYKLPDYWQDTDFTVVEHPGRVQYFNLSMTNDLKGKGYIEVSLTGPDEQPIIGATFELYKGTEKLAENSTGSDGKLTFGDPDKLAAGSYLVRQVTSATDLLPTAEPTEVTILDNGDPDQKKEVSFSNVYRGKGTATVTLTRKDNNNPISGASFELYKDGELFDTRVTDSNGQLTFGDPDKLLAGNYSIKQISTATGLEPVKTNDSFAVVENGDPDQTHTWDVQNEDEAGNVTIRFWKKQNGTGNNWNWVQLDDYPNLKPGRTYYFTASLNPGGWPSHYWYNLEERESNHNRTIQGYEVTGLNQTGSWDSSTHTYHFTITPQKDNTIYSYALITDWNNSDIYSIEMDVQNGLTAAPAPNRSASQRTEQSAAPKAGLQSSVMTPVRTGEADESDTVLEDSAFMTASGKMSKASATRDASQVVTPSDPPSADYIEDPEFKETYKITKDDNNWKHVFNNLDKYDYDENPYYYFVVEKECVPETYHVISYGNDNLNQTGTITITNEVKRGALTIEKHVTVDQGAVPEEAKTIADGDYTFSVTGPNDYSGTATVTVSQGEVVSTVLSNLLPGEYTITETGTTNTNGISLVKTPVVITVAPDSLATANVASFTNDLDTTQLEVHKVWTDRDGNVVDHTQDPIEYKIYRVPYHMVDDPENPGHEKRADFPVEEVVKTAAEQAAGKVYLPFMKGYTGVLKYDTDPAKSWKETVTRLPRYGRYTPAGQTDPIDVLYEYYVTEETRVNGYKHFIEGGEITDTEDPNYGNYSYEIKNVPMSPTDQQTQLNIEKTWEGGDDDLHKDDTVVFRVTQKKYVAEAKYMDGDTEVTRKLYPITINLVDEGGTAGQPRETDTRVVYVPEGASFTLTPIYHDTEHGDNYHESEHVVSVGGSAVTVGSTTGTEPRSVTHTGEGAPSSKYYYPNNPQATFTIDNVDSAKEVTLWLYAGNDVWVKLYDENNPEVNYLDKSNPDAVPDYHKWTCELSSDRDIIWDIDEVLDNIVPGHAGTGFDPNNPSNPVATTPYDYTMRLTAGSDNGLPTIFSKGAGAPGFADGADDQAWKGSITELMRYEYNGDQNLPYVYTYEVIEAQIGSETVTVSPVYGTETPPALYDGQTSKYLVTWNEQPEGTWKFTNKAKETTEVSAVKKWVDSSGQPMTPPDGATVTFTLFADGTDTGKAVVLRGMTVAAQIAAINADSEMTDEEKAEAIAALQALTFGELETAWKAEWKDLPKYNYEEITEIPAEAPTETPNTPIVYTVEETLRYPGYQNMNPDGFDNNGEITNKQIICNMKIVKVDADNRLKALSGAKFQLTRKLYGEDSFTKFVNDSFEADPENENKKTGPFEVTSTEGIILGGLLPGEYRIEEKTAPEGYVITLEPFTFTLGEDGTVTLPSGTDSLVVQLQASGADPAGLEIGNTPGATLPNTGGPGTGLIYLFGVLLIGIAGAGLVMRRKKKAA